MTSAPRGGASLHAPACDDHLVAFYEHPDHLVGAVRDFVLPAFAARDAVVLVATAEHGDGIRAALASSGADLSGLEREGRLTVLDADRVLANLVSADGVDPARFRATLSPVLDRAVAGGRHVRVFGEMVSVLWHRGQVTAAIELEDLWNELARRYTFALFCAYDAAGMAQDSDAFRAVCDRHSAVVPTGARRPEQPAAPSALDRTHDRYVAMVVHDIRGPAAMLATALELLRADSGLTPAERERVLDTAIDLSSQIERRTSDVLDVARIEAGALTFDLRPLDLVDLAETATLQLRLATGRRIVVTAGEVPPVLADEERQHRILANLLSNAIKFSPVDSTVTVTLSARDGSVRVRVEDEGDGIASEDLGSLFEPFSRPDRRDRSVPGSGVGLYTVKALVEGQGGTVEVASEPGRGSVFTYTVPAAPPVGCH